MDETNLTVVVVMHPGSDRVRDILILSLFECSVYCSRKKRKKMISFKEHAVDLG